VLKVFGENVFGELFLTDDNEADSVGSPSDEVVVLLILQLIGMATWRRSNVFFKKLETDRDFLLLVMISRDEVIV
jgi:hypothetical protein